MAPIVDRFGSYRDGRDGAIAQLGERVVRNDEVGGSIPPGSTSLRLLRKLRLGKPAVPYRSEASEGCRGVARRAKRGGARRDRTADLVIANDALSQLSYGPVAVAWA